METETYGGDDPPLSAGQGPFPPSPIETDEYGPIGEIEIHQNLGTLNPFLKKGDKTEQ